MLPLISKGANPHDVDEIDVVIGPRLEVLVDARVRGVCMYVSTFRYDIGWGRGFRKREAPHGGNLVPCMPSSMLHHRAQVRDGVS